MSQRRINVECDGQMELPWEAPFGRLAPELPQPLTCSQLIFNLVLEELGWDLTPVLPCQEGGTPKRGG